MGIKKDIHQYSSTGSVSGISGNVDMNYVYKEYSGSTGSTNTSSGNATNAIAVIQTWLNSQGASITVDGIAGTNTKKAIVKLVQKDIGVTADGIYGAKSKAAWRQIKQGVVGMAVWCIQARLICLGYPVISGLNGIWDSDLTATIKAFQKDKGLSVDGIVGVNTAYALFA